MRAHRPDCFGAFAVRGELGASRFGPVYLGRDPSTNTPVAIRTFELSREGREVGVQSDLLDALRQLCETTLDHPSLARPLAFGAEGDIPYVVYSDLAGTAMDVVMRQDGVRPVSEVLQRAQQLAEAIDFAASAGVHHGMMAPCDVTLDGERTGVTGFGLAAALIKAGIPVEAGSPYGSPQRLAGAAPALADDIYSLAAITIELLIGTPRDPEQDTSRALREAQGIPERRRIQRPAAHETRLFTMLAGVDGGKLRAAFAAAFSEEPSDRPSTACEFVARLQDSMSSRRGADEPPAREEPVAAVERRGRARRRKKRAMSPPLIGTSHEHEPRERTSESHPAPPEPIAADALLPEVTALRAPAIDEASYRTPVHPGSRAFIAAAVVVVSFAAGFGGGFVAGYFSKPSTEPIDVARQETVAAPQPMRAAVEDPLPVASTQTVAAISNEKVSNPEPIAVTAAAKPAVDSGRLRVRSTPAGAAVVVDGQSRGVTPIAVGELAFGAHTIEVSHPGHDTRKRRVTLNERRPARSLDFALRPASAPADSTAAMNGTGSLQVASRPSGAQVFVDDSLIGTTPLLLSDVAAGSRSLRIELAGYKIWTTSVRVKPSARFRVSARLEP